MKSLLSIFVFTTIAAMAQAPEQSSFTQNLQKLLGDKQSVDIYFKNADTGKDSGSKASILYVKDFEPKVAVGDKVIREGVVVIFFNSLYSELTFWSVSNTGEFQSMQRCRGELEGYVFKKWDSCQLIESGNADDFRKEVRKDIPYQISTVKKDERSYRREQNHFDQFVNVFLFSK
jgi:hypothetical protein